MTESLTVDKLKPTMKGRGKVAYEKQEMSKVGQLIKKTLIKKL